MTTPRAMLHMACFDINNLRLTQIRLPRPCRPSPRRFLPEARGRACRGPRPEISDITSRLKISYVLRARGCIEGCWSWDLVYHRWNGFPKACRIEISQSNTKTSHPSHTFIALSASHLSLFFNLSIASVLLTVRLLQVRVLPNLSTCKPLLFSPGRAQHISVLSQRRCSAPCALMNEIMHDRARLQQIIH